ncbi:MAG: zf-HC2 domain-containing protein [Chloroflexi bacterium]|nr:zf-HC2 domain-containing protein [Chloroflexota bacterium]
MRLWRKDQHAAVRDSLSAYLDERLPAKERRQVEQHLAACQACRGELETLRATVHAIRSLSAPALPRSFRLPATAGHPATPRAHLYAGALRFASAAASLALLAVFLTDVALPSRQQVPQDGSVASLTADKQVETAPGQESRVPVPAPTTALVAPQPTPTPAPQRFATTATPAPQPTATGLAETRPFAPPQAPIAPSSAGLAASPTATVEPTPTPSPSPMPAPTPSPMALAQDVAPPPVTSAKPPAQEEGGFPWQAVEWTLLGVAAALAAAALAFHMRVRRQRR